MHRHNAIYLDKDKNANSLPAPASGPFNLTVRDCYWPKHSVPNGTCEIRPVLKAQ